MITITNNGGAITSSVDPGSVIVTQNLTNAVDTAQFSIRLVGSRSAPVFDDDIVIYDGADKIFGGKVASVSEVMHGADIAMVRVQCVDHTFEFDRKLAAKTYENQTINEIISDLVASYQPTFGTAYAASTFVVQKVVFNQVPLSQCLRKLADMVRYDWYIDEDKQIHFFEKNTNIAPFDLTDTDGNYVFNSLSRASDGSQLVNRVKVRGGEYDGSTYTDVINATGSATAFSIPYKMANLAIRVDTGGGYVSQGVGIEFIDVFGTAIAVLYNYQTQGFRFGTPLAANTKVEYSGNPKIPVLAIAEDSASVATYGVIEKLIKDTSIVSNEIARRRGAAELIAFNDLVIDASFKTYTAGLRTGMLLRVSSSSRGFDDDLLIKRVTFKARTTDTYEYKVDCISTQRYTLLDLLRKIVTPDPRPEDEREVSEQIYAINETINTLDEWTNVQAQQMTGTVTATDVWLNIAGNTIVWVYGYYAPTSHSDTKRMGRYDRSAKYQ